MPEFAMPYWDAVRRWNAGGTSWCIPRKGTPGYDAVMAIRRGEPAPAREEATEPKTRKKRIRLPKREEIEMETAPAEETVTLPTHKEKPKKILVRLPKREPKTFEADYTDTYRTDKFEQALEKYKDTAIEPALRAYQEYITEINKTLPKPVRRIDIIRYDVVDFDKPGHPKTGVKEVHFGQERNILGHGHTYYEKHYQIYPEFKDVTRKGTENERGVKKVALEIKPGYADDFKFDKFETAMKKVEDTILEPAYAEYREYLTGRPVDGTIRAKVYKDEADGGEGGMRVVFLVSKTKTGAYKHRKEYAIAPEFAEK